MMIDLRFITIHPAFIQAYLSFGVYKTSLSKGLAEFSVVDLRDYSVDKRGSVDGTPYGGGDGMVMRPDPLAKSIQVMKDNPVVIMPSPSGGPFSQSSVSELSTLGRPLVLVCGRFAGVDQRFVDKYVDYEFSLGDFVISGGELPALMIGDALLRQLPGALGNGLSASHDSYGAGCDGILEHAQYTKPAVFENQSVPPVLMSGNHKAISRWKKNSGIERTQRLRPDLL